METVETVRPIFGALIAYNPYRGATNNFKCGIESRRMVYAISDKIHALASVPQKSKLLNRRTERRTDTTSPQCISHKDVNHKKADAAFASFFLIQQQVSYAFQETRWRKNAHRYWTKISTFTTAKECDEKKIVGLVVSKRKYCNLDTIPHLLLGCTDNTLLLANSMHFTTLARLIPPSKPSSSCQKKKKISAQVTPT